MAELRGDDARHLTRVLRAEAGQLYEISDNSAAYLAEIAEARGERVVFRVLEPLACPEPPVRLILLASLIKFDRFEWIVEKATEVGVERISPVAAARTDKGLFEAAGKRRLRWQRVAQESSQQARRVRMTEIAPAGPFETALAEHSDYRYFLDEAGGPPLLRVLPERRTPADRVSLLTGPEGGWTQAEREGAIAAGWQPASLGPLVLRAETAALTAASGIVLAWTG